MIIRQLPGTDPFFRVHGPKWASQPLSGAGAATRGGRFNRPGHEALYLSADAVTALAEYQQDNPFLPPGTICQYVVGTLTVADISAGFDPQHWSPLWADHACDWRKLKFVQHIDPPTWDMADLAIAAGCQGIMFPSAANPGGVNLVVYDSSALPPTLLGVIDPGNTLPANQSSWGP